LLRHFHQQVCVQPQLLQAWRAVLLAGVGFRKNFDPILTKPADLKAGEKLPSLHTELRAERRAGRCTWANLRTTQAE
jgi:hypothetical protein